MAPTPDPSANGPLGASRKMSSVNTEKLANFVIGKQQIEYKRHLVDLLRSRPVFSERGDDKTLSEQRELTMRQILALKELDMTAPERLNSATAWQKTMEWDVLGGFSASLHIRNGLLFEMPMAVLVGMGTERHRAVAQQLRRRETTACFALTELSHGSDIRRMRTRATFEPGRGGFVLHSPDTRAAKCWVGGLGQTSYNAVVFAQLYTPDGACHGPHAFFVPIRDPATHRPHSGVTVGDMGHKLGLNGVDNGFVMFDNYFISGDALLNKNGDVTPEGQYVSPIKDNNLRMAASLGALSAGRVSITFHGQVYLRRALTVALRYCSARCQFGDDSGETPVIQYPLLQWRLFPFLAGTYVWYEMSVWINEAFADFVRRRTSEDDGPEMALLGAEIHALSSGTKPVSGWLARDGIQESREACGGHGYLSAGRLGEIRNDQDASLTYEGDNNVLLQQLSNFLLQLDRLPVTESPLHSIDFLLQPPAETSCPPDASPNSLHFVTSALEWVVRHLLSAVQSRQKALIASGLSPKQARLQLQVHGLRPLAIAFIQLFALRRFGEKVAAAPDPTISDLLTRLGVLYGLWCLDTSYMSYIAAGSYLSGQQVVQLQATVRELCSSLLPDLGVLVDVIAPDDFLLDSCLGSSDGKIYEGIWQSFLSTPGCTQRPHWWQLCRQLTARL